MADAEETDGDDAPKKRKKTALPMILGLALALGLGGGGFFASYSGMLDGLLGGGQKTADEATEPEPLGEFAFVEMEPMLISVGEAGAARHLRFRAHLEVAPGQEEPVARQLPRVMDVLNSYLRAVSLEDLENPAALIRLRAQMLRRVQLVVGEGRVRDLLVSEFVLS